MDPGGLQRRDGPPRHSVVGGVDCVDAIAECGQRLARFVARLVGAPVGRVVLLREPDFPFELAQRPPLEERSVVVGRGAMHRDYASIGVSAERIEEGSRLQATDRLVVEGDVVVDRVGAGDQSIVSNHRHAGRFARLAMAAAEAPSTASSTRDARAVGQRRLRLRLLLRGNPGWHCHRKISHSCRAIELGFEEGDDPWIRSERSSPRGGGGAIFFAPGALSEWESRGVHSPSTSGTIERTIANTARRGARFAASRPDRPPVCVSRSPHSAATTIVVPAPGGGSQFWNARGTGRSPSSRPSPAA